MAYTSYAFTITQVAGSPANVVITSVTAGTDAAVTQRRVWVYDKDGNYIVPTGVSTQYNQWALATNPLTLDILEKDMALKFYVQWLDVNDVVLYDSTQSAVGLTLFAEQFDYEKTQLIAANSKLTQDNNYMSNKYLLRTYIDSGNQAISLASDLVNAQLCYDEATNLRVNAQYYFNENS